MDDVAADAAQHAQVSRSQQLAAVEQRTPGHDENTQPGCPGQMTDDGFMQAVQAFDNQEIAWSQCQLVFRWQGAGPGHEIKPG